MTAPDAFRREQRAVAWVMAGGLIVTIVVLAIAVPVARSAQVAPFADRLRFALRLDVLIVGWVAAAVADVARLRFFSREDIAGSSSGPGSERVARGRAVLQNTCEQAGLAMATQLVVVATFSRSDALVLALACLFCAGRLLFRIGYRSGARGRAFGFALSFYPSVLALAAAAGAWFVPIA